MSVRARMRHVRAPEAGYTLVEIMIVVMLVGVVSGMAAMIMPRAIQSAKADSGSARVVAALRTVREQSIAQRRTMQVQFTAPNRVVVSRVEVPGPGTTPISTVLLEDGMTFQLFTGIPDTPDLFGRLSAIAFGTATSIAFTSEGSLVDQNGDPVNGTVFIGKASQPLTARAVSIFGPTALVREWRWNGNQWTH
jgi:prepilin-type N-terminal cleavage/methylation domain-containing protein